MQVITAQTKKFNIAPGATLQDICALLSGKFLTGADIGAFTSRAYANAMERLINSIEDKVDQEMAMLQREQVEGTIKDSPCVGNGDARWKQTCISSYISRLVDAEDELRRECHDNCDDTKITSELDVVVTLIDFEKAARELKPAASELDMKLYMEQKEVYDS